MKLINGFPRRYQLNHLTETEELIKKSKWFVEHIGTHPLLTEAIMLLEQAQNKVADFIELK